MAYRFQVSAAIHMGLVAFFIVASSIQTQDLELSLAALLRVRTHSLAARMDRIATRRPPYLSISMVSMPDNRIVVSRSSLIDSASSEGEMLVEKWSCNDAVLLLYIFNSRSKQLMSILLLFFVVSRLIYRLVAVAYAVEKALDFDDR